MRPKDLKDINKKEIFILKPGSDPQKFRSYEKYLVDLDIPGKLLSNELSATEDLIDDKRRQLLGQKKHAFHFLDQAQVARIFHNLRNDLKFGEDLSQLTPTSSGMGASLEDDAHPNAVQREENQTYKMARNILGKAELKDPEATVRFLVSAHLHDFLGKDSAILDLEFSHGSSKALIAFDAHVKAIQKEGYIFEDAQLTPIRRRLGLKDKEEILGYFRSLSERLVIMSASFSASSHGNRSGYYELYLKHPDSAQVGTDLIVSALIPKTEVKSKFKPLYDSPKNQPFEVTFVGTVMSGLDSLVDGKYMVSMMPIAVYS